MELGLPEGNAGRPNDSHEVGETKEGRVEEYAGGQRSIREWGSQPDSTL